MSCCCCFDDCRRFCWGGRSAPSCCCNCCRWLSRHGSKTAPGASHHPHIHYSPVSTSSEDKPATETNRGRRSQRTFDEPLIGPFNGLSRGKMPPYHYAFTQAMQQRHIHPQFSLARENHYSESAADETVTDQPSASRAFTQRFELVYSDTHVTSEKASMGVIRVPGLPVYRERAIREETGGEEGVNAKKNPSIQFSLHYDLVKSKLNVSLHHAMDLPTVHCSSTGRPLRCDPFVMLHLEPDRRQTHQSKKIKGSLNPEFDENFVFDVLALRFVQHQTLVLRMFNGAQGNRAIGKACLPLSDAELFGAVVQMKLCRNTDQKEMEENYQGDLHISLSYSPVTCKLEGIIHKATGLRKHDVFGKADPYVKVVIKYKGKEVFRWKSSVKHNTLAPVYNESFTYQVTEEMKMAIDVADIVINFFLIDYDYLTPNDKMGIFSVGRRVPSKLGRQHWNEVLRSHCQRISFWHPIQLVTPAQLTPINSASSSSPVPTP